MTWGEKNWRTFSLGVALVAALVVAGASLPALADDGGRDGGGSGDGGGHGHDDGGGVIVSGGGNSGGTSTTPGNGNSGSGATTGDDHGNDHGDGAQQEIETETHGLFGGFEATLKLVVEAGNDRSRVKVEVEDANLPVGTTLNVCLNGSTLGSFMLNGNHEAELELETEHDQTAFHLVPGDVVEVRQDACGSASSPLLAVKVGGGTVPPVMAVPRTRLEGSTEALVAGFEAELQVKSEVRGDRQRFSAEVENLNLPPGTMLNVCAMAQGLGTITLDTFHSGDLELDSRRGDTMPSLVAGQVVEVRQDACGSATAALLAVVLEAD